MEYEYKDEAVVTDLTLKERIKYAWNREREFIWLIYGLALLVGFFSIKASVFTALALIALIVASSLFFDSWNKKGVKLRLHTMFETIVILALPMYGSFLVMSWLYSGYGELTLSPFIIIAIIAAVFYLKIVVMLAVLYLSFLVSRAYSFYGDMPLLAWLYAKGGMAFSIEMFIPFAYLVLGMIVTALWGVLWANFSYRIDPNRDSFLSRKGQTKMAQARASPSGNETDGESVLDDIIKNYPAVPARFTYQDVRGMTEVKKSLNETLDNFIKDGGNGLLLFGEPGNGKTFMVEAFAGEHNMRFLNARTSELSSKWIGETTMRITELFKAARAQAPCLIFLDEVDSFLMDRGGDGLTTDERQSANTFLTQVSELNHGYAEHGILIVAATNFLDKLDTAAIREGRFDKKVEMSSPDNEARKGILLNGLSEQTQYHEEDIDVAIKNWAGFSVSRMMSVSKTAEQIAKKEKRIVDFKLLEESLRKVQGSYGEGVSEGSLRLRDFSFTKTQELGLTTIVDILKERHELIKMGVKAPKGALFFGPAGTGKTTVAKALAAELNWAFLSSSGPALLQDMDAIKKIIQKASDLRPTIIFIDESEDLLANREANPHTRQVTNYLLEMMDGVKPLHDVFFIAATNHPDGIDPAILRWGRFSEHIDFTPTANSLHKVMVAYMSSMEDKVSFEGDELALAKRYYDGEFSPSRVKGSFNKYISKVVLSKHRTKDGKVLIYLDKMP